MGKAQNRELLHEAVLHPRCRVTVRYDKTITDPEKLPPMKHDEHARMHMKQRRQAERETETERKALLTNIVKETIEKESIE